MKFLRELHGASQGDAKIAALQSPVWRDKAIEHEAMVDSLLNELDVLGKGLDGRSQSQHIFSVLFAYTG